jgi:cytochrome P450
MDGSVGRPLESYHFLKLGEETLADPYPFFARLRREAPVFREPDYGVYLVSRFDDIETVSRRTDVFSSAAVTTGPFVPLTFAADAHAVAEHRAQSPNVEKLFHNDPPDHTRYRALVAPLFLPSRMIGVEAELRAYADELIDRFIDDGRVEFVESFAHVLPLLVVSAVLGVPKEDAARLKALFEDAFAHMDQYFFGNPDGPRIEVLHHKALKEYFTAALAERRAAPLQDALSVLANTRFPDGGEVPLEELVNIVVFMYSAGGDSNMPQVLTNGMKILAENPAICRRLREDPGLLDKFVSEVLRYETSALGLFRLALQDVEIGGVTIPRGGFAMMLFASGNHDEKHFESPEEFRLDRPVRRLLSFGSGVHTCVGQPLARLQAKVAFGRLVARLAEVGVAETGRAFTYLPSSILRSVRRLELNFTAA